jgi:hypothetical protein
MKLQTELLEGIVWLRGVKAGKMLYEHLQELLSYYNKVAAYEPNSNVKSHYSGRSQQLYELIAMFDTAGDTLDKRKNTVSNPS